MSRAEQHARGVEAELQDGAFMGATGSSLFPQLLSYVDHNDFFVVPWMHAALFGVLADFWKMALATHKAHERPGDFVIPHASRRAMKERQAELRATSDFGRPLR